MAFIFPEDKADFTAPNGVTYSWDGEKWVTKTFKADETFFRADQDRQDDVIDQGLEVQRELQDDVAVLTNKVNALEGSVIDAIWTFEQDDRVPRAGEFALRAGAEAVTADWSAANQIVFNEIDHAGNTYTFEKITINDVIRCGAADGTGAEYKIVGIVAPGWFSVEHLRSSPDAADEQEYAFTFLQSFDPAGLATINYVDAQDDLKLNLSGGTLTNRLFFDRGNSGANMVISPNSGDVNSAIYALNGGYIRFRSSLTEDLNVGTNTHITFGRNPETNSPQTNIYHLQYPEESTHAANKQYVDDRLGTVDLSGYLPLTGGTLTGGLTMETNQNFMIKDNSGTETFRIQANGFCRTTDLFRSNRDDGGPGLQCRVGGTLNAEIRCDGRATFKSSVKKDGKELATEEYVNSATQTGNYLPLSGGTLTGTLISNATTNQRLNFLSNGSSNNCDISRNGDWQISMQDGKIKFGVTADMNSQKIVNVAPCTNNNDAANKKYVDDKMSGGRFYMSSGNLYWEVS